MDQEGVAAAYVVVPPDGGWGWVIMIASFMINFLADGQLFAFSALNEDLEDEFGDVSTVIALVMGLESIFGPVVSAMCNRLGFRIVAMSGGIISGIGFSVSYYADSVTVLCLTYGVLGGIGFSMAYMPAVIAVGFYFEKWRALATCVAVCGTGVGGTFHTWLVGVVVQYGWRYTVLMQGGFAFCVVLFALLLRPLEPIRVTVNNPDIVVNDIPRRSSVSSRRMASMRSIRSLAPLASHFHTNNAFPTAAQMGSGTNLVRRSNASILQRFNDDDEDDTQSVAGSMYYSGALSMTSVRGAPTSSISGPKKKRNCCSRMCRRFRAWFRRHKRVGARPFYRDDIMYDGSLARLPQYNESPTAHSKYHMAVTHVATQDEEDDEATAHCVICPQSVTRTLATMLDFSLFRSPTFLVLNLSMCAISIAYFAPYMYIPGRARKHKMDKEIIKMMMITLNVCNTLGRILGGVISFFPQVNALIVFTTMTALAGITTLVSGLSFNVPFQFSYAVLYGLCTAILMALRPVLLVDMLGLERLTNAFGLLLLFNGSMMIIGLKVCAALKEGTGHYYNVFYFTGAMLMVAAVVLFPLRYINRIERARARSASL